MLTKINKIILVLLLINFDLFCQEHQNLHLRYINNKIYHSKDCYFYHNKIISFYDVKVHLKEQRNDEINLHLNKAESAGKYSLIYLTVTPIFVIGVAGFGYTGYGQSYGIIGYPCISLSLVCLTTGIIYKLSEKKHYNKSIEIYNNKFIN